MCNSIKTIAVILLGLVICMSGCSNRSTIDEVNISTLDSDTESSDLSYSDKNTVQGKTVVIKSNEAQKELSEIIFKKSAELSGKTLGIIDRGSQTALAVILHDEYIYDYWFFNGTEENLILSSTISNAGFRQKNICGEDFLIVYEKVVGHAHPADIAAIIDGKPEILSVIDYETEYSGLFYSPSGEIVCMRGMGVSIGSHNVIPYYWNDEAGDFVPYNVKKICPEELKVLDSQNLVEDIDNISSVYQRDNGLVHINYIVSEDMASDASTTASRTYVQTEAGLREYDIDYDAGYGFFLECFPITE